MLKPQSSLLAKSLLLLVSLTGMLLAGGAGAAVEEQIAARLQPAGTVCVFGEECAAGMRVPGAAPATPKTPDEVYNTFCQACHATGANNAPKLGDKAAWEPRIAKGIDALYESAIKGFNNGAMPPRGTCVDCSDEDIHATVDYLIQSVQ
ncbi:MAG: c-type cytochrome [Pseudomonadota bacterium]